MDFSYLLDQYIFEGTNLIKLGFNYDGGHYNLILDSNFDSSLQFEIKIDSHLIEVNCYDKDSKEEYIPFNLKNNYSSHVLKLREEVTNFLLNVFNKYFKNIDVKKSILDYIIKTFNCYLDQPFKQYPTYTAAKRKDNDKWFALFMDVPFNKLSGNDDERIVDVLNLKVEPHKIRELIDDKNYFKAYHMNSKYWVTVLIDKNLEIEKIFTLIEESYLLTY